MAFPGNGKKSNFFWSFDLIMPQNWSKINFLGSFGILSSRRFEWCTLWEHCYKNDFHHFLLFGPNQNQKNQQKNFFELQASNAHHWKRLD